MFLFNKALTALTINVPVHNNPTNANAKTVNPATAALSLTVPSTDSLLDSTVSFAISSKSATFVPHKSINELKSICISSLDLPSGLYFSIFFNIASFPFAFSTAPL